MCCLSVLQSVRYALGASLVSGEYSVGEQLSCARGERSDVVAELACTSVHNAKHTGAMWPEHVSDTYT